MDAEFGDTRLPERFWSKVRIDDSGCWVWTAHTQKDGYGTFRLNGKEAKSHRLAYMVLVGAIPDGLEMDHLCRVRACCFPGHLEAVTHRENMRRSPHGALKTHCVHRHEYTEENTRIEMARDGTPRARRCRTCERGRVHASRPAYQAAYRERNREAIRATARKRYMKRKLSALAFLEMGE